MCIINIWRNFQTSAKRTRKERDFTLHPGHRYSTISLRSNSVFTAIFNIQNHVRKKSRFVWATLIKYLIYNDMKNKRGKSGSRKMFGIFTW